MQIKLLVHSVFFSPLLWAVSTLLLQPCIHYLIILLAPPSDKLFQLTRLPTYHRSENQTRSLYCHEEVLFLFPCLGPFLCHSKSSSISLTPTSTYCQIPTHYSSKCLFLNINAEPWNCRSTFRGRATPLYPVAV